MADIPAIVAALASGHPVTGAYDADDAVAADEMNLANIVIDVESVSGQQIFEVAVPAEYNALSADQKTLFLGIVGMGTILVNGTNTKAALLAMFGPGTGTRTNLAALQKQTVSHATFINVGTVAPGHIEQARSG